VAFVAAAAVLLAAGAVWALRPAPRQLAESSAPVVETPDEGTLSLPTGDRLVRLGEGALDVLSLDDQRRFSLTRGEVLFDVAPLEAGQGFEVVTPHLRARVVGTVFVISVDENGSAVEVYEGEVEVLREGQAPLRLLAGESWSPAGEWRSRLAQRGREAAQRRHATASHVAAPEPTAAELARDPAVGTPRTPTPTPMTAPRVATPTAGAPPPPTLDDVRRWLGEGELQRATEAARAGVARNPRSGEWRMLLGDAQRVARDPAAADTYDEAARQLSESRATQAGYLAAELRLQRGDASGALRSLAAARATERGSPIAERASVLALRALGETDDVAALRRAARDYLLRFPAGAERPWVEGLVAP